MQIRFQLDPSERLRIYERPIIGEEYLIGGDVSEGLEGGNYSCGQVINRTRNKQVATWHGMIEPYELGKVLIYLGYFYNTALLAVERNQNGITTIDYIRTNQYPSIYRMQKFDYDTVDYTERLGWITGPATRGLIIDSLRDSVSKQSLLIVDPQTLDEMKTFVRNPKTGKIEASVGNQDDRVMALAIANHLHRILPLQSVYRSANELYLERIRGQGVPAQPPSLGRGGYFSGLTQGLTELFNSVIFVPSWTV